MAFAHSSLDFNAVVAFNEKLKKEDVESYFFDDMQVPSATVTRRLGSDADEENDVITFYGRMGFQKLDEGLMSLLSRFCKKKEKRGKNKLIRGILLNFEESFFTEIMTDNSFCVSHEIKLNTLSFGTLARLTTFIEHYSSKQKPRDFRMESIYYSVQVCEEDLLARFLHSFGELHVHFRLIFTPVDSSNVKYRYQRYKLVIPYSSIHYMIVKTEEWNYSAYIEISHTPALYVLSKDSVPPIVLKTIEVPESITNNDIGFEREPWSRRTDFYGLPTIYFGKCNAIKVGLYNHENINSVPEHEKIFYPSPFSVLNSTLKFKKFPVYFGGVIDIFKNFPDTITLDIEEYEYIFRVNYAMEALQSISFQFADDILFRKSDNKMDSKIRTELSQLAKHNLYAFEKCLFELFDVIVSGAFVRATAFLLRAFNKNAKLVEDKSVIPGVRKIRRAVLTPTRVLLLPPLPMMESRFIIKTDPEYILSIIVRDDDLQYLTYSIRMQEEEEKRKFFNEIIKMRLKQGLKVCDRSYVLVGSSQSQLRDNGMCLYADDNDGRNAQNIRHYFGRIEEKNVSKYIARVGLMLSQALCFIDVGDAVVKYDEPDITHPDAKHPHSQKLYEFSDGCGMISLKYAEKLTKKLKEVGALSEESLVPSAFQIRLGGCKGMLALNPRLKDFDIVIRDSMRKFESDDKLLGVLKVSDKRKVYLNKPLITVLDQLGVDANVFLQMQVDVLQEILHCFLSEKKAASILQQYCVLHNHIDYDALVDADVNILNEPFFRLSLDNVVRHATFLLKTKGRIQIPIDKGRSMFGVIDETRKLNYGQVFVQATDVADRNKTEIWTEKVLVTKFPCMDPGDVQIFDAVHIKELEHIKDCIVFPANGPRPHPNEMAGSDLDGDEYAVIRYAPLLTIRVNEPMIYPDNVVPALNRNITLDDMLDFYANFIDEYSVGVIAKAHLAWADMLPNGIFDPICKELASMYAVSLDFAKTGINAKLDKEQRVQIYPDFMEKFSQKPTYLSTRALGSLYRQISIFNIIFNEQFPLNVTGVGYELFEHPLSNQFVAEAEKAYQDYKHLMFNIQKTFRISTESEIISGVYNKEDRFVSGNEQMTDVQKVVNAILRNGIKKLKLVFFTSKDNEELLLAKASAYYKATSKINETSNTPYYGLPWIFSEYLSVLAKRNRTDKIKFENETTRIKYMASLIDKKLVEDKKISDSDEPGINAFTSRKALAETILLAWLERQTYLKLSSMQSRSLIVNKVKAVVSVVAAPFQQDLSIVPSVGEIIISVFQKLLTEEMTPDFYTNPDVMQFKFTIGYSSLMTLYRLYRTQNFDHIIRGKVTSGKQHQLTVRTFRLKFDLNSPLYEFVKSKESEFFKFVKDLSGIGSIKGQWFQRSPTSWFFEVVAYGTQTQLYVLSYFLSRFIFASGPNVPAMIQSAIVARGHTPK